MLITTVKLTQMWLQVMLQSLAGNRRVIMCVNRGPGFSTSSEQDYSIEVFARDAGALFFNYARGVTGRV